MTVLVIGGTGSFGTRLVKRILACTDLDVIVAGRSHARAEAFAATCNRGLQRPRVTATTLDVTTVSADELRATGAFAVVDAAGPWQGSDLRLPRAAIAAKLHYVDLADARKFVAGFATLDADARAAGVIALTGASSTPALSNAALDDLTSGWQQVVSVDIAICPGNRAPRGRSVMRAILSYAGRPVRLLEDGAWRTRPGWGLTTRRRIPGVGIRWVSLCDTPDLDIIAERCRVTRSVVFRAGLELALLHLGLLAATMPVRAGLLRSLERFTGGFLVVAGWFRAFGSDRGGMTVDASGVDRDGHSVRATWRLVAEAGDGPFVPTLPALAALRALAERRLTRPTASACVGVLSLAEIEQGFAGLRLCSQVETTRQPPSLFAAALGTSFARLPPAVRALHCPGWWMVFAGEARVDGADSVGGRLAAWMFGFPRASPSVPVTVEIAVEGVHERWTRNFDGRRFRSVLGPKKPGAVVERFGPFSLELALTVADRGLRLDISGWHCGPLPLPRRLAPTTNATESVDQQGRFTFDVELSLPLGFGRLVRYRGWLVPTRESEDRPAAS